MPSNSASEAVLKSVLAQQVQIQSRPNSARPKPLNAKRPQGLGTVPRQQLNVPGYPGLHVCEFMVATRSAQSAQVGLGVALVFAA